MSRARDLAKLGNTNVIAVNGTDVGFGTLDPKEKVNVVGVVSATSFYGDGSTLEGIASAGIGTALSDDKTKALNAIYYTNEELTVNTTSTINAPDSGHIAYTQAPTIVIEDTKEITIADGDDLLVDVLGISTGVNVDFAARGNGVFGNIYVDNIWNQSGQTSVNFPKGLVSSGVATFTSDVSIGGTLTYEDVKNVDSVGLITARTGIEVLAGGINVVGGIDIVGDIGLGAGKQTGTAGQLLTSGGAGADATWSEPPDAAPSISGISSGTIANGAPVILLDDGKLGPVSGSQGLNGSPGEAYYTGGNAYSSMTYDTTNDRVVLIYREDNAGGIPYCKAGTVSGTTISWGTPVQIVVAGCGPVDCTFDSNAGKVVFCYIDNNDSNKLKSLTGTVNSSNNSISLGTIATIDPNDCDNVSVEFCSTINKLLYAYRDDSDNNRGFCRVAEVSGSDISNIGSRVEFGNGNQITQSNGLVKAIWNPTDQKAIIFYSDYNNSEQGAARSVTISGNTPSIGTRVWFDTSRCDIFVDAAYDPDNNKIAVTWREGSNGTGYYNLVRAMSLNGTDIVLDSTTYNVVENQGGRGCIAYDTNANQFLIGYSNQNNAPPQAMDTVTMTLASNGTMTFGTPDKWDQGSVSGDMPQRMIFDPDSGSMVMLYRSNGTGTVGSQYRIQRIRVSNVTSSNFVGFSKAAYTNGQTAQVSVVGSTSTNQTGLTTARQYYVLGDGSVGTTADAANVEAGKSLSFTSLLVKG